MKRRQTIIAAGVGVAVILVMVVGLIRPKAAAVHAKQQAVTDAQQQEKTLELTLQRLQAAQLDAPKDRKTLARLKAEVPPVADLPGLIRLLNKAADQSNVDFMTITPSAPSTSPGGSVSVIPVQIVVTGGFFSIDQYLFQLESLPRISTVSSVAITTGGDQDLLNLQATITANFFTTDVSAGPGSNPAPGSVVGSGPPAAATPAPASSSATGGA